MGTLGSLRGMKKYEIACNLRSLGLTLIDIASVLYPREYEKWRETRDRSLYQRLAWKVQRLLNYGGCINGDLEIVLTEERINVSEQPPYQASYAPLGVMHPKARKAGLTGAARQVIEMEQLLYIIYKEVIEPVDPDGIIWATIKAYHGSVFYRFYEDRRERRVWTGRNLAAGDEALAYAYLILSFSVAWHGYPGLRAHILRWIMNRFPRKVKRFKEAIERISHLVVPVLVLGAHH